MGGRRSFLRSSGAVGVALAGGVEAAGTATAAAERHGIEFDRVVDAVEDLGMDPDGDEPIDDDLASVASEGDALVQFPPGTYLVDEYVDVGDDFGIESTTGDREDVVFRPVRGTQTRLFEPDDDPSGFYVGQVTLDRRDEYRSSLELVRGGFADAVQIHDVLVEGWAPESGNKILTFNVTDPDGSALVDGVTDRGPAQFGAYPDGTSITIFNGRGTEGDITYRNLEIHNASESGIYAGKAKGTIRVEDSYFKNCAHSAVRVTGNDSVVRNTTIVMDLDDLHPDAEATDPEGVDFNRGIWAQSADVEKGGPLVEGCEIVAENSGGGVGGIVNNGDSGGFEIRDTRVECNDDSSYFDPILIAEEDEGDAATPYEALIDGVSVTGTADGRPAMRIGGRDGTVVRNCCIQMPNTDGIKFEGTSNARVANTSISVGGEATVFENADVETSEITSGDSCPLPDPGSWDDGSDGGDGTDGDSGNDGTDDGGNDGSDGDSGDDGSDGDDTTLPHTLAVSKESEDLPDGDVSYEFTVSETLEVTDDVELGGNDSVSGTTAEGGMGPESGVDTYRFAGTVEAFDLEGAAEVYLNGERVAPEEVVGRPDDSDDGSGGGDDDSSDDDSDGDSGDDGSGDGGDGSGELPHTLAVSKESEDLPDGRVRYEFTVSEALEVTDDVELGGNDARSGTTAEGGMGPESGVDTWRFAGTVEAFDLEGAADVFLNGKRVAPEEVVGAPDGSNDSGGDGDPDDGAGDGPGDLPNRVVLDGRGSGLTAYRVSVSGDLRRDGAESSTESLFGGFDEVTGSAATGTVLSGIDVYRFSGDVTALEVEGDAEVRLSDEDG